MIEIILSYMNRITKRVNTLIDSDTTDMYGTGELGNVYYGPGGSTQVPSILNFDRTIIGSNPGLPITRPAQYNNLYIDTGVTLSTSSDWATIFVKNTLYLRGSIVAANSHSGSYSKTDIVPVSLPKLIMYPETNYIAEQPFFITGGTGNTCFGNSANGGGFLCVYSNASNELLSNDATGNNLASLRAYVSVLGGSAGSIALCGGCLIISARNILIANTGRIFNYGGDGQNTSNAGVFCEFKMNGSN